ncbi:MAG: RIP metalloprotease RseP [Ignavibacteria bacterium]|jgi:regulator of sigma E protease|nr:RIP metalloprotease RseP [Ignavibacteria bacterium]MCU7501843.1 RIP metalloprotease RseP [Ignavibacteria bacterium]MCU7514811.1 RIP metalloprotease RseP [Ignavibacteria bacterium]
MNYIIYFLITIAILVFVHEFGHFIAAKISRMRVDVFAIGFGKRLLGWNKLSGFSFGDLPDDFDGQGNTDYRVCLLPFGGYVKIAGMVDESFDVKFADKAPEPYEFRSRPTHQKLFVITAGVLMNLLLAYFVFAGINYFQEKQFVKTTTIGFVAPGSPAAKAGFATNDKILSVEGKAVSYWEDAEAKIYIDNVVKDLNVRVARDGKELTLNIPRKTFSQDMSKGRPLLPAGFRISIDSVIKGLPAEKAGIKKGDVFLAMNNEPLEGQQQTTSIISENRGKTLPLKILRNQDTLQLSVTPSKDGKIGVMLKEQFSGPIEYRAMGLGEAMWAGVTDIGRITSLTFSMLSNVIRGKVEFSSAFGGPVKIAQFAAKSADSGLLTFISFLGMLSLSLAILNILPFPVLDGGHFVIILIEGIMRREIPVKVKLAIQNVGFVILLIFMAFAIYNDLLSL